MSRRSRERGWPADPDVLPAELVDGHTHLDAVLATTDRDGWRPSGVRAPDERASVTEQPVTEQPVTGQPVTGQPVTGQQPTAPTVADHLARAAAVGVTRMVQIGCDLPGIAWTDRAVREHPQLLGGLAIHPNEAVLHAGVREVAPDGLVPAPREHHGLPLDEAVAHVADVARANPRVRVIGETGLDFFRAGERGRAVQREAFRAHIALAKELDLVLQIHDRDAHAEVIETLLADGAPPRTVFHCYSGDAAMAGVCAEHGWYLSFAGPVTYPSSSDLRAALHATSLDRVLLETDAPYLPPHPVRGRPNAPYVLALTARSVAAELGVDLADLCRRVSATCEDLYGPW